MNLVVCKHPEDLAARAAAEFVRIAKVSIAERGAFTVALSGGSTPLLMYKKLIEAAVDWEKVYFFFGDERNVPPSEDASNFRNANKELFRPLRIRENRIFRWRTELSEPEKVADDYFLQMVSGFQDAAGQAEQEGGNSFGIVETKFDLILLGMGSDGHTASLFPGTEALNEEEKRTVANWVPQLGAWRYTLSFPAINLARNVIFLVAGADKADTLRTVFDDDSPEDLPSKRIRPVDGDLTWFVDQAAAGKLIDLSI